MHASQGAPTPLNYIANPRVLYVHEIRVWDEGQEYGCGMTVTVLRQFIGVETPLLMNCRNEWNDTMCILKVVCISVKQISPICKPCVLHSIDSSKRFFASSSTNAHLWMTKLPSEKLIIWVLWLCAHAERQNTWYEGYCQTYHEYGDEKCWYEVYSRV